MKKRNQIRSAILYFQVLPMLALVLSLIFSTGSTAGTKVRSDLDAALFYPSVETLSTRSMNAWLSDSLVVDVRSRFEYDTVHIEGSVNLPLNHAAPGESIEMIGTDLDAGSGGRALIFVGADSSDTRPYRAALSGRYSWDSPPKVYGAGVLNWAEIFPGKTVLMGVSTSDAAVLVSSAVFRETLLEPAEFMKAAKEPGRLVIDVRSPYLPELRALPSGADVRRIPVESLLEAVGCRVWSEKDLLIVDADGTRLKWLLRFLLTGGYPFVRFLDGGARSLDGEPEGTQPEMSSGGMITIHQERLKAFFLDSILSRTQKGFFMMIIAGLSFDNCCVMNTAQTAAAMEDSPAGLRAMADVLKTSGVADYASSRDYMVFRIDPELAWKGSMQGAGWEDEKRIFKSTVQGWRFLP